MTRPALCTWRVLIVFLHSGLSLLACPATEEQIDGRHKDRLYPDGSGNGVSSHLTLLTDARTRGAAKLKARQLLLEYVRES